MPHQRSERRKNAAAVYTFDKNIDDELDIVTKEDLKASGIFLNDPHHRVNDAYAEEFGKTSLDVLGFNDVMAEDAIRPLLNKDPRIAAFSPMNILLYRKKSDMKTVVSHIDPEAAMDIAGVKDPALRKAFVDAIAPIDAAIEKRLGGKKSFIKMHKIVKPSMMHFGVAFDAPEDMDEFLETFQEDFESAFQNKGFVIAGFYNVKESFNSDKDVLSKYASFWVYNLCHIPFSYAVFDGDDGMPEAGIFAPCDMYVYVRKGENKVVIGMPRLDAWGAALGIEDKAKAAKFSELDADIPEVIKGLGGVEVGEGNPFKR